MKYFYEVEEQEDNVMQITFNFDTELGEFVALTKFEINEKGFPVEDCLEYNCTKYLGKLHDAWIKYTDYYEEFEHPPINGKFYELNPTIGRILIEALGIVCEVTSINGPLFRFKTWVPRPKHKIEYYEIENLNLVSSALAKSGLKPHLGDNYKVLYEGELCDLLRSYNKELKYLTDRSISHSLHNLGFKLSHTSLNLPTIWVSK